MNAPIENDYFQWIVHQLQSSRLRDEHRTYWNLYRQMHRTPFVFLVPMDANRFVDGKVLRGEFLAAHSDHHAHELWMDEPCSFLELFLVLCRMGSFEDGASVQSWAKTLLYNTRLLDYTDYCYGHHESIKEVEDILDVIIWRRYDYNGNGGLFPLQFARKDQRTLELWEQMGGYLSELMEGG